MFISQRRVSSIYLCLAFAFALVTSVLLTACAGGGESTGGQGVEYEYIQAYQRGAEAFRTAKKSGSAQKYEEAARHFDEAATIYPDSAGAHLNEAYARIQAEQQKEEGDKTDAIPTLEKYMKVATPPRKNAFNILSALYLEDGQVGKAISLLEGALERFPDEREMEISLLNAYSRAGEVERAVSEYQRKVEENPYDATLRYNYGSVLVNAERYDEAITQLERARQLSGEDWEQQKTTCTNLFTAYVETRQPGKAKAVRECAGYKKGRVEQALAEKREKSEAETSSEPKIPESRTDQTEGASTASVVDTDIPKTGVERPDDIAVVIGNRNYQNPDIPDVDYAVRDAKVMKKYLTRTLGFREENIIYVENASSATMERVFGTASDPQGQLYNWIKPGESSVLVYYSGHGAPNPESGSPYFIPSNTNPNYLSQNGYPVNQLYENLAQLPAEAVTVVLEACFSGVSESGAVVSDISPAVLSVENPVMTLENGLAFTAGAADQVSTWYSEKGHGLFTYYFLSGLRGEADANGDDAITAAEMKQYVGERVPYRARRLHNREQTPQVVGQNLDRVLVRYSDAGLERNR